MERADESSIYLGRDAERCDLVVDAEGVSPVHCRIAYDYAQKCYVVEDLGSATGTFLQHVRRERLHPGVPAALALNDALYLGPQVWVEVTAELVAKLVEPASFQGPARLQANVAKPELAQPDAQAPAFVGSGRTFVIGRDPTCDIRLSLPNVSRQHLEVEPDPTYQRFRCRDLGSANGFAVGRPGRRLEEAVVGVDAVLYLGASRLPMSLVRDHISASVQVGDVPRLPRRGVVVLGRAGGQADLQIDWPMVALAHAEVTISEEGVWLRDLGSSGGTFVDGVRVRARTRVRPESEVSLAGYRLRLVPGEAIRKRRFDGPVTLQTRELGYAIGDDVLLEGISFTLYPTELVGLMGPSGAGKTTLLQAMNGYRRPLVGQVLVNGNDLYASYAAYQGDIGYVPQDDVVFPRLTVGESLSFTARLRLPEDTSPFEIERRVDDLLRRLGIEQTRNVRIGSVLEKGISGGQRKRVNLAQELLTEPSLLFLDEPTSGLASQDALEVMTLLRQLADGGRTVVLTIHQPSMAAYRQMDNVIYLFEGRLVFYGPTFPDSIVFLNEVESVSDIDPALLMDPGQALRPLAESRRDALYRGGRGALDEEAERRRLAYKASPHHREYVEKREEVLMPLTGRELPQRSNRAGFLHQVRVLAERTALLKRREEVYTATLLAQAPVVAIILGLVFFQKLGAWTWLGAESDPLHQMEYANALLFLLVASSIWFGCSNAAREIVAEQAVYVRERMVNLRIDAYVVSKCVVLGGMCAVQCLVLLGLTWFMLDIPHGSGSGSVAFLQMLFTLVLSAWAGLGMGLLMSSLVRSGEAAVALIPILLIPQIILGGLLVPGYEQDRMVRALSNLTASRWGFEAMLHLAHADASLETVAAHCLSPEAAQTMDADAIAAWVAQPCCIALDADHRASAERGANVGERSAFPASALCDLPRHWTLGTAGSDIPWGNVHPSGVRLEARVGFREEPVCATFCQAAQLGRPITALDHALGADLGPDDASLPAHDAIRRDVERWLPGEARGSLPRTTRSSSTSRGASAIVWCVLLVMTLLLLAAVAAVLRLRDPLPR